MKVTPEKLLKQFEAIASGSLVHNTHQPEQEMQLGETEVGVVADVKIRSLYSFHRYLQEYLSDYTAANLPTLQGFVGSFAKHGAKGIDRLIADAQVYTRHAMPVGLLSSSVKDLYQAHLTAAFPALCDINLGGDVRKGWRVVVWKSADGASLDRLQAAVVKLCAEMPKK